MREIGEQHAVADIEQVGPQPGGGIGDPAEFSSGIFAGVVQRVRVAWNRLGWHPRDLTARGYGLRECLVDPRKRSKVDGAGACGRRLAQPSLGADILQRLNRASCREPIARTRRGESAEECQSSGLACDWDGDEGWDGAQCQGRKSESASFVASAKMLVSVAYSRPTRLTGCPPAASEARSMISWISAGG